MNRRQIINLQQEQERWKCQTCGRQLPVGRQPKYCDDHEHAAAREVFELTREPMSLQVKPTYSNNEQNNQRLMFDGLDCLPGQLDLF